ncbi:MAG TPA: hypothetical protein H9841_02165 [Candidatus Flavonifractor merdigallinarum]|uniref:Uncharacterized protein n=1 Tax=Candidatus Flavonifractor merdigallinarum TaxID=2838589 RepID=A0A9D1Y7D6_9FIRM|nr:hypothetical protein [Candidatus Flavonifractor merdigallinarum]
MVQSLAVEYRDRVEVKIYRSGVDTDYVAKYGAISKSMLIVNESKAIAKLSKSAVRNAFEEALKTA